MNLKAARQIVAQLFASVLMLLALRSHAQVIYSYDASGNVTNWVLNGATTLTSSVSSNTQTVSLGGPVSLSVIANGSGIITYQWQFNGMNIAGATNATFYLANAAAANAGAYTVIVSNGSTSQTNQFGNIIVFGTTNTLYGVTYALNQFIAVGANGTVVGSSNLVSWASLSSGTSNSLQGVAFTNNTFVAVGAHGTVLTSTNGTAWATQNSGRANNLNGIACGHGLFVAVGSGGITLTSPDGTNWTQQTFDNPTLEGVTFSGSLFVAVGTGGTIWTSGNGTNWLGQSVPTGSDLYAVTYGGSQFIAAGEDGTILSSPDGTNWTAQDSGTSENFNSVLCFNGTFYALGPVGQNFVSPDGVNWNPASAGTYTPLYGSTAGNNLPVAVGEYGTALQIPTYQLDHFSWNAIASPQRTGQSFATTITAQDAANNTVSNFNGTVTLSALASQTITTNTLLNYWVSNSIPTYTNQGSYTLGYSFTPNANLLVTQVRHFDVAQKVCIWDGNSGTLLASIGVTNIPGQWVSTPVPVPLTLTAGNSYVVTVYTGSATNSNYYYREDGLNVFANGTIDQALLSPGDANPIYPETAFWFLVDLGYTVQNVQSNGISPATASFVNGVATPNVTLSVAGQGVALTATDSGGHTGTSAPFSVFGANDLSVTLAASPSPVPIISNLTYTVTVLNAGPSSATGVTVTNVLPANASVVSFSSSQGTCLNTNGQVTCSLGNLASQTTATITIIVTPTTAGVILTNTVNVTETGTDSNLSDNTATNVTYVPPELLVLGTTVTKSYTNSTAFVSLLLFPSSVLGIQVNVQTVDGTAVANQDYVPVNEMVSFPAGSTNGSFILPIVIQGNTTISATKQFTVQLSSPVNVTLFNSAVTVSILNNNGLTGQLYNLVWGNIPSPQRTNTPFGVNLTAQDAFGATITNFSGSVALTGINVNGPTSNTLLPSPLPASSANNAIMTVGYEFTPTNDIYVTHVRSYAGSKVSIWTATGYPLVSQNVTSVPGTWVDTPLTTPIWLQANNTYIVGAYTRGSSFYWREDGAMGFPDGLISQGVSCMGDAFPTNLDGAQWYLVDLRYSEAAKISPTNSGNFVNGVWTGNIAVGELGTNFLFMANDGQGHLGFSSSFGVYQTNDLAVTLAASPPVPLAGTNIIYTITVLNPGPNTASGVLVTNTLPAGVTFVSASISQGTWNQTGNLVTANLGTIAALTNATVAITVLPKVAGLPLTNSVTVTGSGVDPNSADNTAVSVVVPSQSLVLQLANALNYSATPWLSGGDALWQTETNTTHDGTNAAQSGAIVDSEQTWVQTTVYGPGSLSFWWSVSSQVGGDYLNFFTNGVVVTNISGSAGWQQMTVAVAPGHNVLQWNYIKDPSISSGADAGWLDQVVYNQTPVTLSSPTVNTNSGNFVFTLNGTGGQILVLQSSTNLFQWTPLTTNILTGSMINLTNGAVTNYPYQFFRTMDVTP